MFIFTMLGVKVGTRMGLLSAEGVRFPEGGRGQTAGGKHLLCGAQLEAGG